MVDVLGTARLLVGRAAKMASGALRPLWRAGGEAGADEAFVRAWSEALASDAAAFTGLYAAVSRIAGGGTPDPWRALGEWMDRARFRWGPGCGPLEAARAAGVGGPGDGPGAAERTARLLVEAVGGAGVASEAPDCLVLGESNVCSYVEIGGAELYIGDVVRVLSPAWYQGGELVEQGLCASVRAGDGRAPEAALGARDGVQGDVCAATGGGMEGTCAR